MVSAGGPFKGKLLSAQSCTHVINVRFVLVVAETPCYVYLKTLPQIRHYNDMYTGTAMPDLADIASYRALPKRELTRVKKRYS